MALYPSYRHNIRARLHSYTTDSAASRLPETLTQVSSGMISGYPRLGPRANLSWCGGMWSCQEIKPAPAPRGWFPSAAWEEDGGCKVVLFDDLMSSDGCSDEFGLSEIE